MTRPCLSPSLVLHTHTLSLSFARLLFLLPDFAIPSVSMEKGAQGFEFKMVATYRMIIGKGLPKPFVSFYRGMDAGNLCAWVSKAKSK